MKMKYLVIVSLILAVLTIGAASASEDVAIDDELAVSDDGVDIEEAPADDVIGESEDSEPALSDLAPSDFNVQISDSVELDDDAVAINYTVPNGVDGWVYVYLNNNNEESYYGDYDSSDSGSLEEITLFNLDIDTTGTYTVLVKYVPYEGNTLTLKEGTLTVINKTYDVDDFNPIWTDYIDESDDTVLDIWNFPVQGTLEVYVDGNKRYNRTFDEYGDVEIYLSDLNITSNDDYFVSARYITDSQTINLGNVTLTVEIDSYDQYVEVESSVDVMDEDYSLVTIDEYEDYVAGTISIYVDGTLKLTKSISASQKLYYVSFTLKDLGATALPLGKHKVKAVYMRNNAEMHQVEKSVTIYAEPVFDPYPMISYGEKAQFIVYHLKGFKGTATLYNAIGTYHDEKGKVYGTASFVDGAAIIYLTSLPEGVNYFILNVTGYDIEEEIQVNVINNTLGISASVEPTTVEVGNSVTLKLTGPKDLNQDFFITVDGESQGSLNFFNVGAASKSIKFTTVGTHVIHVISQGSSFYSNTFYVTVKAKQTPVVKKATKITAKKATFKANKKVKKYTITLKAGKAAVKSVKITLKVGKKTYKVKTNKKGKATFKITKLTKKGTYKAVIKFAGDKNYKASKKTVKIIVKK